MSEAFRKLDNLAKKQGMKTKSDYLSIMVAADELCKATLASHTAALVKKMEELKELSVRYPMYEGDRLSDNFNLGFRKAIDDCIAIVKDNHFSHPINCQGEECKGK